VRWNLITIYFQQVNSDALVQFYINIQHYLSYTVLNFHWNRTYKLLRFGSAFNFMHGILYEVWWHTGLSNISELIT
jgi:hypothetical protein